MNRKTKNIKIKFLKTKVFQKSNLLLILFRKHLLKKGKEVLAHKLLDKTLFLLELIFNCNSLKIVEQAILNSKIEFSIKTLNSSKIPLELDSYRSINFAIKNIILATKRKSHFSFSERLAYAIIDAYNKTGEAVIKRLENIKLAQTYKTIVFDTNS
jgi:ribosomal protein S7